jgi:POT family proton-dependent oligopeptide transporter
MRPRRTCRAHGAGSILVTIGTAGLLAAMIASDYVAWINPVVYALPIAGIVWFGVVRRDGDSHRIAAILVFFVCAILFWAIFEQAGSSLTLFADELTRNELLGFAFPSSWFQSVNSLFILALAPLFAWLWVRLRERQPSMPMKFVWGLVLSASPSPCSSPPRSSPPKARSALGGS